MFYFFNPVLESHYTNILNFHHGTSLLRMYNGSSFNKGTEFFLLLGLNFWIIVSIPTLQCLLPSTTHWTDLSTIVYWTHCCTFTYFLTPIITLCPSGGIISQASVLSKSDHPFKTSSMSRFHRTPAGVIFSLSIHFWLLFILLSGTLLVLPSLLNFWITENIHFYDTKQNSAHRELAVSLSGNYLFL